MIRQLRYSAIGVLLAMSSCASEANEANFEAKLNKLMKANNGVTETSCQGEGNWEEVSKNNFLFRCKTDIPSQGSQVTSPPPTQELPSQNVQGCDAVKNAILNIVDYYRFGNTQSHSQSQLENHVRTISSFLRGIGFGMEANGVDNATSLGDVLSLSQNIVEQKCGI